MAQSKKRFLSVDFFRGFTVAFMIVANNPGDTAYIYSNLLHSHWHGWTLVDFIFPIFLYIVGISIALAVPRDQPSQRPAHLWPKAYKRAGLLFLFGLFLNGFPSFNIDTLRIPGVLQRIAVVYLATLWLHLHLGRKKIVLTIALILIGYWMLWACVPVPGLGFPTLDYEYNLESWLDQLFMRGHLWEYDTTWDPEGILSTLPCIALALLGVCSGDWLKNEGKTGPWTVFAIGLVLHVSGLAWDIYFPINKVITTSSFVLFVGGVGLMLLAIFHRFMDAKPMKPWEYPFIALGKNALFIYISSELFTDILFFTKISGASPAKTSLHSALFKMLSQCIPNRYTASMLWAILIMVVFTLLAMLLDRRKYHVRL